MINVCIFLYSMTKKGCNKYGNLCRNSNSALSAAGKTRLDRERAKMCQNEMVSTPTLGIQISVWGTFINFGCFFLPVCSYFGSYAYKLRGFETKFILYIINTFHNFPLSVCYFKADFCSYLLKIFQPLLLYWLMLVFLPYTIILTLTTYYYLTP